MSSDEESEEGSNTEKVTCRNIAEGLSEIIRFSIDENFRQRSFAALGVQSTKGAEKEIYKKLRHILKCPNHVSRSSTSEEEASNTTEEVQTKLKALNEKESSSSKKHFSEDNVRELMTKAEILDSMNWLWASSAKKRKKSNKPMPFLSQTDEEQTNEFPIHNYSENHFPTSFDSSRPL